MTSVLTGDFPHVFCWFAALDTPFIWDFRQRWPTLEAVQQPADATWRTFFQAHHAHNRASNQQRLAGIRQALPATTDQAVMCASGMLVQALVEPVGCLTEASARVEKDIAALTHSPADVPIVTS